MATVTAYNGNDNLKRCGVDIEYTQEQILELKKCSEDPIYFIDNYCQIVTLDKGIQPFKMWDFQKELIETIHNNRMVIGMLPRQSSKCHSESTVYAIRNKKTGEIHNVSAKEFHEICNKDL